MPEIVLKDFDLGQQMGQCRREFSMAKDDFGLIEMVGASEPMLRVTYMSESGVASLDVLGDSNVDLIDALYDDEISGVLAQLAVGDVVRTNFTESEGW